MRRVTLAIAVAALSIGASHTASAQDILAAMLSNRPVAMWNGVYVGGNLGYGYGTWRMTPDTSLLPGGSNGVDGMLGGIQIGGNAQSGIWVLGFEADFQGSAQKGSTASPGTFGGVPFTLTSTNRISWFSTGRLRAGVAVGGLLFYGTGGLTYGEFRNDVAATGGLVGTLSYSTTRVGWVVGGGIEGMITKNWAWKAEYLHLDTPSFSQGFFVTAGGVTTNPGMNFRIYNDIVRVGVNYYLR